MRVCWLSLRDDVPARGYWDQALLADLLADAGHADGLMWHPDEAAVVVLPGAGHAGAEDEVSEALAPLPGAVLVVTSDEEARFDATKVEHPAIRRWAQYGPREGCRPLPVGYTPHTRPSLAGRSATMARHLDVSFAGQVTHPRRRECAEAMDALSVVVGRSSLVLATDGFAEGLPRRQYVDLLASSRITPCPPGPVHPDTFRVWEALEAGAVPVIDVGQGDWLAETVAAHPLPVVAEWSELGGVVERVLADWPWWAARCVGWWTERKRVLREALARDVEELS